MQLFARGVSQIYYVGLLAGKNDRAAVERTGEGRAVNRHDYTPNELRHALHWRRRGQASCSLRVNRATGQFSIDDRGAA
jgi:hypothetical protein